MKPHEIERHQAQEQNHLEIVLHLRAICLVSRSFCRATITQELRKSTGRWLHALNLLAPGWRFHSIQNIKFQSPLLPENHRHARA